MFSDFPSLKDKEFSLRGENTFILGADIGEALSVFGEHGEVVKVNSIYKTPEGSELGFTDRFIVELKPGFSKKEFEKFNLKNGVEVFKETEDFYVLRVSKEVDVLEMANTYFETGNFVFSHPDFYEEIYLSQVPNDPFFVNQFYLDNTGQVIADGRSGTADADIDAPEAWTVTMGSSNITVAVIDTGVSEDHIDLPNSRQVRLPGSNFVAHHGGANNPSPGGNHKDAGHGDACAGIIASTWNNGIGVSGVAPGVKIMPIRVRDDNGIGATSANLANSIDFARVNNAQIISCSWILGSTNPNHVPAIVQAITRATTLGRNGLGCVVVFGAGNNADHIANPTATGQVMFPSNVNVPGVLTVGASDRYDMQANYSPSSDFTSAENQIIDLVAPSSRAIHTQITGETNEVFTIDMPGNPGFNPVKSN